MKNDEGNILDMDFGTLMGTSGEDIGDPTPTKTEETPPVEVEKPVEDELLVNDILETGTGLTPEVEENEDTKTKETKEKKAPSSSEHTEQSSSDPFALVYAKFLLESGSISSFDEEAFKTVIDEEGEASALQHLISGEIESAKATITDSVEGFQKEYTDLRNLGFTSEEAYSAVNALEEVENITTEVVAEENNEELRKNILTTYYQETTQFSEDRIKKLVDRSFELGDDVSEATEALESLKVTRKEYLATAKVKREEDIKNEKLKHQRSLETLKEKVNGLDEIIPGQKINKTTKTKIEDLLTKPVKQLEDGTVLNGVWAKRADDQLDFDLKLAHFINIGLFDGKFDSLKKRVKSSAAEELEAQISRQGEYTGSGRVPAHNNEASKNMISSMRGMFK